MDSLPVFKLQFLPVQVMWIALALILSVSSASYQQDYDAINATHSNLLATAEDESVKSDKTTESYKSEVLSHAAVGKACSGEDCKNVTDVPFSALDHTIDASSYPSLTSLSPGVETTSVETSSVELVYSSTDQSNFTSNYTVDGEELNVGERTDSVFNAGVIAGISALVILIIVLFGVVGFMVYRYFSWNRPQTLSDKFSNDESTGYIDDTALRENSEEMYSLDNDSFLNSLEAMTIQNYWTDQVKHTKLDRRYDSGGVEEGGTSKTSFTR